jgi:multiple sugar transport system substrate-binding protein
MGLPMWIKIAAGVGIFLFFLLLILFSFRGGAASGGKVTLTYWGLWENKSTMDQLFADFHRQYPNITVVVSEEDPKQYSERLLTRIKNGTGPDVFAYHNSWIPEMLPVLSPLSTAAITTDEFTKSFYPVAQKDLINRGAIYGIPLEIDTLALFVNNNILKANGGAAPKTWDDFNAIAAAATVKDANGKIKTSGAAMGVYDNIIHASDIVAMLFAQNGANLTNLASTVKNASDALNFYSSFGSTAANNIWDTTLSPSLVGFSQGNVAMCFGYSYDIFAIRVMNPTLDFSVYPVPHLPNRPITIASYWVQGVSANSAHQKEAMLLMHFLAQKDTEEKMYALEAKTRPFGEPYARVDLADTLKNDPFIAPFLAQAPTAVSTYFSSSTYDTGLNAQMNGYLANTVRSILSNTSVDTAVTTLSQGVTQILQQYGVQ